MSNSRAVRRGLTPALERKPRRPRVRPGEIAVWTDCCGWLVFSMEGLVGDHPPHGEPGELDRLVPDLVEKGESATDLRSSGALYEVPRCSEVRDVDASS